jgi:hypothetical protein
MAKRISAALPFLSAEEVELYQPLLLPLGLQLTGFLDAGLWPLAEAYRTKPAAAEEGKPETKAVE